MTGQLVLDALRLRVVDHLPMITPSSYNDEALKSLGNSMREAAPKDLKITNEAFSVRHFGDRKGNREVEGG